jgi:GxxExxY protein
MIKAPHSESVSMAESIDDLTHRVIACAFTVHNTLGAGFLEKVYEEAMALEMTAQQIRFVRQAPIAVQYRGMIVGDYIADFLIEERLICELKALEWLNKLHEVQLVNYLAATGIETGLLINFGSSVTIRRKFRQYRQTTT